uniref:Secreted protein n=1 Tax=Heterorhabditis bacteriophora TaxID=37862 RepID=A0A1I7WER0_HETBA
MSQSSMFLFHGICDLIYSLWKILYQNIRESSFYSRLLRLLYRCCFQVDLLISDISQEFVRFAVYGDFQMWLVPLCKVSDNILTLIPIVSDEFPLCAVTDIYSCNDRPHNQGRDKVVTYLLSY